MVADCSTAESEEEGADEDDDSADGGSCMSVAGAGGAEEAEAVDGVRVSCVGVLISSMGGWDGMGDKKGDCSGWKMEAEE